MKTGLISALKRKGTAIISAAARSRNPLLIMQRGRPSAYLVDIATFDELNEKLAGFEAIGRGERAIQSGRVLSHRHAKKRMLRWLKL